MTIVKPSDEQKLIYTRFCHFLNRNGGQLQANDAIYYRFLDAERIQHETLATNVKLCHRLYPAKPYVLHLDGRTTKVEGGAFYLTKSGTDIVAGADLSELPPIEIPVAKRTIENLPPLIPNVQPTAQKKTEPEWTKEEVIELLTTKAHIVGRMLGTGYDLMEQIHGDWIAEWIANPKWLRVAIHQAHRDSYKCFGPATKVMMADGTSKKVEDVKIGDYVMGWDSTPRVVLDQYHGSDEMYKVTMNKNGEYYTCNKNHILTLKQRPIKHNKFHCIDEYRMEKDRNIINIPIEEFINNPASRTNGKNNTETFFKHFKIGVEFNKKDVKIPPYILGLWIGDGSSSKPGITTMDSEIYEEFSKWALSFGLNEYVHQKKGSKCKTYTYHRPNYIGMKNIRESRHNEALSLLKDYNLIKNKHIPHDYLQNDTEARMQLLAGLIDTDGHYSKSAHHFIYATKLKKLAKQVEWLARSLGFCATAKEIDTWCVYKGKRKDSKSWHVYINGKDIFKIPTRLKHKKAQPKKAQDDRHMSFSQKIEPIGKGKFYGFTISGDGMFLLDNFLVVHNTSSMRLMLAIMLILQPTKTIIVIRKSEDAVKEIVNGVSKILDTPLFKTFVNILYPYMNKAGGFKKTTDTALAIDTNLNVSLSGEYQLRALGLGSPLTGKHASLIITDDIVSTADRESEAERRSTISKYQEMMNLLSNNKGFSDTRILNIGTPWHEEDAFQLMERGLKKKTEEQERLEEIPTKERTKEQIEQIRQLDMKRGKFVYNCYQTGLMTEEDIEWKKQVLNDDVLFAANYMLTLVSDEECPFPRIKNVGTYSKDFFVESYETYAHIDAKYSGVDTCALTIGAYDWNNMITVVYGRLWKVPIDQNYIDIAEIMYECGVQKLYMETNTDKGLMGDKFRELGFDTEGYHEHTNKNTKIVNTLRPFWREKGDYMLPCVHFVAETDEEYLSQVHNYKRGVRKDDAPDSLASLLLKSKFGAVSVRVT